MVKDLVSSEKSTILSTLERKRCSQNRQTVIRKYQVQNNQPVQKKPPKMEFKQQYAFISKSSFAYFFKEIC